MVELKRLDGSVIAEGDSLRSLVLAHKANLSWARLGRADLSWADLREADLRGANLSWADLCRADLCRADLCRATLGGADLREAFLGEASLREANLRGADLRDAHLPTGETWETYLADVVPALLTAGGQPLASFAESWQCHSWSNCPIAHAFGADGIDAVPALFRPRTEQFVQFFDADLIPCPVEAR
jgi:uncharacterized protein YjbI with pentapeptide repeats